MLCEERASQLTAAKGHAMSTKELQQRLVANLREWQKLENAQITLIGDVLERTSSPAISVVMEIVQRDSQMHHRVQQLIIDSLESEVVGLPSGEVADLRDRLRSHLEMEEETVRLARQNVAALSGSGLRIQEFLMNYLLRDEEKHRELLTALEHFLDDEME
jgi:hypothetical protein